MSEHPESPTPPAETTDEGAPIRSRADRVYGPPRAAHLAFAAPQPLVAYAVPLVVVAVVASAAALAALRDSLSFANGEIVPLRVGSGFELIAGAGLLSIAIIVAHAFGVTAATLVLLARADGRRLLVRDAWGGAVRRPGSVALVILVSALLSLAAVGIAAILLPLSPVAGVAAALLLVVVAVVTAPLQLAWPQIVGRRKRLGAALAWAWRSTGAVVSPSAEPFRSPRVAVVSTVLLTGLVTVGLSLLGGLLPVGWWTPVVSVALALVPAALAQVLLTAVAVRGVAVREEDVALAPLVSEAATTGMLTRGGMTWGLAALLVPAVIAGVVVSANPLRITSYTAVDVPVVWRSSQIVPWEGGTAVLSRLGGESADVRLCSGSTCSSERDMRAILPAAIAPAADGGLLSASWYPVEGADDRTGGFELRATHSSPDALRTWAEPLPGGLTDDEVGEAARELEGLPGEERVLGGIDSTFRSGSTVFARSNEGLLAVAIDTDGDRPVIASVARPLESLEATVAFDFCADAACTSSERVTLPLVWGSGSSNQTSIDVALAADGRTAVATLADGASDDGTVPLRVLTAAPDGATTIETLDSDVPGAPVTTFDDDDGAQMELGSDGLPVVLYRAEDHATLRVFTCGDLSCTDPSVVDIDPPSDLLTTPALVIDSTGRPLIGIIDGTASVGLLSCDDATCATRTTVPLVGIVPTDRTPFEALSISLDAEDRPLLASGVQRMGSTGTATWNGTILSCTSARCGAD